MIKILNQNILQFLKDFLFESCILIIIFFEKKILVKQKEIIFSRTLSNEGFWTEKTVRSIWKLTKSELKYTLKILNS